MSPKEKANELIDKCIDLAINFPYKDTVDGACIGSGYMTYKSAVDCALIAVDEIIKDYKRRRLNPMEYFFWQQVKQELETIKKA